MNFPNFEKYTLYDESIVTIATNTSSPILTFKNQREMKTPMQELIEEMRKSPLMYATALDLIDSMKMLEKEEKVITNAYWDALNDVPIHISRCKDYYNETFKN